MRPNDLIIKPEDFRHLVAEYLPATPSYELSKAICAEVNRIIDERLERAPKITFKKGSILVPVDGDLTLPFTARLVDIRKIEGDA